MTYPPPSSTKNGLTVLLFVNSFAPTLSHCLYQEDRIFYVVTLIFKYTVQIIQIPKSFKRMQLAFILREQRSTLFSSVDGRGRVLRFKSGVQILSFLPTHLFAWHLSFTHQCHSALGGGLGNISWILIVLWTTFYHGS